MSFDTLAPHYRWMEFAFAGERLHACRTAFLPHLPQGCRVLIAGEGNGRFLAAGVRQGLEARFTCLDSSPRMLAMARARLRRQALPLDRVEFVQADILHWEPPAVRFDVVVTHFFLDCFRADQLPVVIGRLAQSAAPAAQWLVADFRLPAHGWRRIRARLVVGLLYLLFRLATGLPARELTSPDRWLRQHGFRLRHRRRYDWGLLHSDHWIRHE